jgi:uncharacterized protein (UPF0276 family)
MDDGATEGIVCSAIAEMRTLVARFGAENVVLENLPLPISRGEMLQAAADPAVIRRVVLESGCRMLLDISHASISARTLGINERDYISGLPVERIAEIHMTGTGLVDGSLSDHLAMTDYDWGLFDWAITNIRSLAWPEPKIIAVEYGGIGPIFAWRSDSQVIARDIPRFYRAVQGLNVEASLSGTR